MSKFLIFIKNLSIIKNYNNLIMKFNLLYKQYFELFDFVYMLLLMFIYYSLILLLFFKITIMIINYLF